MQEQQTTENGAASARYFNLPKERAEDVRQLLSSRVLAGLDDMERGARIVLWSKENQEYVFVTAPIDGETETQTLSAELVGPVNTDHPERRDADADACMEWAAQCMEGLQDGAAITPPPKGWGVVLFELWTGPLGAPPKYHAATGDVLEEWMDDITQPGRTFIRAETTSTEKPQQNRPVMKMTDEEAAKTKAILARRVITDGMRELHSGIRFVLINFQSDTYIHAMCEVAEGGITSTADMYGEGTDLSEEETAARNAQADAVGKWAIGAMLGIVDSRQADRPPAPWKVILVEVAKPCSDGVARMHFAGECFAEWLVGIGIMTITEMLSGNRGGATE